MAADRPVERTSPLGLEIVWGVVRRMPQLRRGEVDEFEQLASKHARRRSGVDGGCSVDARGGRCRPYAHHVMGGRMPATFAEGLLSGLGHPVIGIDHLAFIVAVGLAVGVAGLSLAMPAALCRRLGGRCGDPRRWRKPAGRGARGGGLQVILAGGLLATGSASRASPGDQGL